MLTFIPFLLFGLVNAQIESLNITISTLPTFSTCRPAQISWSGGSGPYRVCVYPDNWTNVTDWLVELPVTTRPSTVCNVNLAAGTGIVVNVWDGVSDQYSEPSWIQDSGDITCLASNGTFQSSSGPDPSSTALEQPIPISTSRVGPSVVSTPSQSPTRSQHTPASSVASSAEAPPATVTVIQGNGAIGGVQAGKIWVLSSTFLVLWFAFRV